MTFRHSPWALAALLCCAALDSASAIAAELSLEQSTGLSLSYSDNLNLTTESGSATAGYSASHSARLAIRDEIRELSGGLQLRVNRYTARPDLDSEDATFDAMGRVNFERDSFAMSMSYVRDPTLASELSDTGIVQPRVQRTRLAVSPRWSHALTTETSFQLSYAGSQASYSGRTSLEDYSDQRITAGLVHVLSPRTSAQLSFSGSRFETDSGSAVTDTISASIGIESALTERLRVSAAIGPDRSRSERRAEFLACRVNGSPASLIFCLFGVGQFQRISVPVVSNQQGVSMSVGVNYALEAGSIDFSAARGQSASGLGEVVRTNSVALGYSKELSEALSYGLTTSYVTSNSAIDSDSESRFFRVGPTVRWRVLPDLTLNFGYAYAHARRSGLDDATENAFVVGASYAWPKQAQSF